MEPEILNKLNSIEGRIDGIESRLGKLESLSVAMSQKLVAVQGSQSVTHSAHSTPSVARIKFPRNQMMLVTLLLAYFAGYELYNLASMVSAGTSFLFMIFVTVFGLTFSLRNNSQVTALVITLVGFLTPYLFGLRAATDFGYFVYMIFLNAGLLSVAFLRRWRLLALLGFVGSTANLSAWYSFYYTPEKLAITLYALGVFYLIYLAVAVYNEITHGYKMYKSEIAILILNPIWFIAGLRYLLESQDEVAFIIVAIATCALYIALVLFHLIFKHKKHLETRFLN